jgi:uncharacterized protein (DUF58 family)
MNPNEFLSKLYKYEIKIRKAVTSQMRGNFHSIFKGSGLEFSDLRLYQYGDDVRLIDWNTSAKGHGTYIKIFKEEKEQTVFFVVDVSASQNVGRSDRSKLDTIKEISGVLTLSAIKEASHVGLLCFSDQKEKYIKPANTLKHGYRTILELFKLKTESAGTNLKKMILFTLDVLKRRSLVILVSDFIDTGYEENLKALARRHDLIVIHLYDQRETNLPRLGIIPVFDTESRKTIWVNASSNWFRNRMKNLFEKNSEQLDQICKQNRANYLAIDASEDYVPKLIKLFRVRK